LPTSRLLVLWQACLPAYNDWLPDVQKAIKAHGNNKTTTIIGDAPPNRVTIIQFPSVTSDQGN
jgi:hypothetical protein